jgi:hypothetical protein
MTSHELYDQSHLYLSYSKNKHVSGNLQESLPFNDHGDLAITVPNHFSIEAQDGNRIRDFVTISVNITKLRLTKITLP